MTSTLSPLRSNDLLGVRSLRLPLRFHARSGDAYCRLGNVSFSKNSSLREYKSSVNPLVFE